VSVNTTYARILKDNRHSMSVILSNQEIDKRQFSGWTMGYVLGTEKNRPLFLSYSASKYFEPLSMRGTSAELLLAEIGEHARHIGGIEIEAGIAH
jgi:hypothetical protein